MPSAAATAAAALPDKIEPQARTRFSCPILPPTLLCTPTWGRSGWFPASSSVSMRITFEAQRELHAPLVDEDAAARSSYTEHSVTSSQAGFLVMAIGRHCCARRLNEKGAPKRRIPSCVGIHPSLRTFPSRRLGHCRQHRLSCPQVQVPRRRASRAYRLNGGAWC